MRTSLPLALILSFASLEACTSQVSSEGGQQDARNLVEDTPYARGSSGQIITVLDRDYIIPQAVTMGTLRQLDACLVFDNGSNVFTTIWPQGSRMSDGKSPIVMMPYGRPGLPLDEVISLGGGEVPRDVALGLTLSNPIPPSCPKPTFLVG